LDTNLQSIPYAVLFRELDIDGDVRELEDLIIESIYMGVLTGRLDQRGGLFRIKGAIGRDVRLEDIDGMMDKLQKWCVAFVREKKRCVMVVSILNPMHTLQGRERRDAAYKSGTAHEVRMLPLFSIMLRWRGLSSNALEA
jgi:hypothetical protein